MLEIRDGVCYFDDKSKAYELGATQCADGTYKAIATEYTTKVLGDLEYTKLLKEHRTNIEKIKDKKDKPEIIYDERLRPYQNIDVQALSHLKQKGIFNAMRTGKTPTSICSIENENYNRVLVVCPSFLKYQWRDEFEKWSSFNVEIVNGTITDRVKQYKEAEKKEKIVLVVSYDTIKLDMKKYMKLGTGFDCILVDEAHFLRNLKTDRSKCIFTIGSRIPNRYALTGTPAVSHPSDIFGILKFLYPNRFRSKYQFCDQFFEKVYNPFTYGNFEYGSFKNNAEKDFQNYLSCMSIQRKQKDVMSWLPEINKQTIELDMTPKQASLYKKMKKDFLIEIGDKEIDAQNALVQATRLNQISVCPEIFGADIPSSKINFIVDYVKENPLEPIIVFSTFTSALKVLNKKIKGSVLLTGEQTAIQKKKAVDDFQKGKTNVILANIQAGSVGWTLDRATTEIFLNRSFIPVDNQQAEARFIPTKNVEKVSRTIIDLVNLHSKDRKLLDVYKGLCNLIQLINDYKLGVD